MLDRSKAYDIVCIGHICHDLIDEGFKTGGAVYFAALETIKSKKEVCVLTSIDPHDISLKEICNKGVVVMNQESKHTTCFINQYVDDKRVQFLPVLASSLRTEWILSHLPKSKAVFICPVADEIDVGILEKIESGFLACSIQGWLRKRNENGQVVPKSMGWNKLKYADVIFLSYEDIDGLDDALAELCLLDNIIVVTDGDKGADIFINGNKQHFPAVPSKLVDPTGAGDIFATAFIIRYLQHNDLSDAMIHAHLAASEHIAKTR
ncbi:MAG: hypothetical protein HKO89_08835 [Saprospiraceae bacterium]|nr:hypothetical protein [Saprospiraceae bacterium]